MSRVTRSTLRSAAASGLAIVATLGLASCGGNSSSDASSQAPTPSSAAAAKPPAQKPFDAVLKSKVAVTKEGKDAITAASTKKVSASKVKSEAKSLLAEIKKAGIDVSQSAASSGGPVVLQAGSTTIMVYPSEQLAATQAASFIRVIDTAKTDGRIARYDRTVIATSAPDGMTKALQKEFKTIQKAVQKQNA